MSTWKDFLKTPEDFKTQARMSKSKEPKSNLAHRKKLSTEADLPEPEVKEDDGTTTDDSTEEDAPRTKTQTRTVSKPVHTPPEQVDEEVPEEPGFKVVAYRKPAKKSPADLRSIFVRFCDESLYTKKGMIFNIMNNQCHGTSQYVKALRINLSDPTELDAYLAANLQLLKTTAALLVYDYFLLSRVNLGQMDDLTTDEYSPSFTFASLSEEGRSILPNGEEEGPLWFGMFPHLLKKTRLRLLPDGRPDEAYVINFRLHQVNPNIRIRPPTGDGYRGPRRGNQYTLSADAPGKKGGNFMGPRTGATITPPPVKVSRPYNQNRPSEAQEALAMAQEAHQRSLSALHYSQEAQREVASLKTDKSYPLLPDTPAPRWPDSTPSLPDSY